MPSINAAGVVIARSPKTKHKRLTKHEARIKAGTAVRPGRRSDRTHDA